MCRLRSRLHAGWGRRRVTMGDWWPNWVGTGEQYAISEQAERLVIWTGGTRIQHPTTSVTV
jgi:hypothetical protein